MHLWIGNGEKQTTKNTNNKKKKKKKSQSLFYCCLHSDSHAVILQPNTSLQLLREKENVTQELEILQSSAACSTTSSLGVVSNKVRLLEKNKKNPRVLASFIACGNRNSVGWGCWESLVGWGCWEWVGLGVLRSLGWLGDSS